MLVDTGAAATLLDTSLEPTGESLGQVQCAGASGLLGDTLNVIKVDDLSINGDTIEDLTAIVWDMGVTKEGGIKGIAMGEFWE